MALEDALLLAFKNIAFCIFQTHVCNYNKISRSSDIYSSFDCRVLSFDRLSSC